MSALLCACGHVLALHAQKAGCAGTFDGVPCSCPRSRDQALVAPIVTRGRLVEPPRSVRSSSTFARAFARIHVAGEISLDLKRGIIAREYR